MSLLVGTVYAKGDVLKCRISLKRSTKYIFGSSPKKKTLSFQMEMDENKKVLFLDILKHSRKTGYLTKSQYRFIEHSLESENGFVNVSKALKITVSKPGADLSEAKLEVVTYFHPNYGLFALGNSMERVVVSTQIGVDGLAILKGKTAIDRVTDHLVVGKWELFCSQEKSVETVDIPRDPSPEESSTNESSSSSTGSEVAPI